MTPTIDTVYQESSAAELGEAVYREILSHVGNGLIFREIPRDGALSLEPQCVWYVKTGLVSLHVDETPLMNLTPGILVGPWMLGQQLMRLTGEAAMSDIVAVPYAEVEGVLAQSPRLFGLWNAYIMAAAAAHFAAFVQQRIESLPPLPQYRSFQKGDPILKEGEFSREVLVLVEGNAEVVVQGEKVGEVHRDEIFGALAALTGTARGATVIASKPSVCMVFERDDFEGLLRTHSKAMTKLVEDVARAMGDLNKKVVKREKSPPWLSL